MKSARAADPSPVELEVVVGDILASRKYRDLGIPADTVRDLLQQQLSRAASLKEAVKEAKRRLHNVVATYLGDAHYPAAIERLRQAATSPDLFRTACADVLASHASTRERLAIMDEFYPRLWAVSGKPKILLDLACGLNPISYPWMGLDASCSYHVYDLNLPRIQFINQFFGLLGLPQNAIAADILLQPPFIASDVALFFKEAHRFEQRQHGCNLPFWKAIQTRWLLVSLPVSSLSGRHSLIEQHRRLVYGALEAESWQVSEVLFSNELVFCIDKGAG